MDPSATGDTEQLLGLIQTEIRELVGRADGFQHSARPLGAARHFSNTLFYDHQMLLYESIVDFLNNECGNMSAELQASADD